jgi:hypothetical protein
MENNDEKRLCLSCGRTLRAIGTSRANGKAHKDWNTRNYHKSCYKNLGSIEYCKRLIKQYADEEAKL